MRQRGVGEGRPRRLVLGAVALLAATSLLILVDDLVWSGAVPRAAGQSAAGEPTPQTDDSVPASNVTMIGASPEEAHDETWALGLVGSTATPVRYTPEAGWSLGPGLQDEEGHPLSGFKLDQPGTLSPSPLAGQMTPDGGGALVGTVPGEPTPEEPTPAPRQVVLVRDPGGAFRETSAIPSEGEASLQPGESLFGSGRAPLLAPIEETSSQAGVLLVPVKSSGVEEAVLHWDGTSWSREPIEIPAPSKNDFRVLAIGASSPANAWLLAQLSSESYPVGAVALFRRRPAGHGEIASWRPVALVPGAGDGEAHPLTVDERPFTVRGTGEPPTVQAQVLTVTSEGVWIDGERSDVQASTTMFFKPEGEDGGHVVAGWCKLPASAPAGTRECDHPLPDTLPTRPSRSIAWANSSSPFGERVITGLPEGVSLRLDASTGSSFTRVLALGGSEPPLDVGGTYGAAFSSPREGWLGQERLPVHLTTSPAPNRLTPWPVSFRHALLAIAPQPGAPIGSLSSEALAVGDLGEIARYEPGNGWVPESLLGAGGRRETPRLRAVAWPTQTRAYAVGDLGQMWLWRGETGLWESDPATPLNFRGNLLGIAFDPNDPARGYAVGQDGVLLSYGKSWTQEESLPAQVAGADFTSIAFAGSEAIVAYRKLVDPTRISSYVGGLLVNDGSGWRIDQGASSAMGSAVPGVVAGLVDGGAAFTTESPGTSEGTKVFERESAQAAWQAVSTPLPGSGSPGSIALFREGGALRLVASGSLGGAEVVPASPPGFPPPLIPPYGIQTNSEKGVLRQTATGWSDEEHELNNARESPGSYRFYDTVYKPDPISAVLIDPAGAQGWAVGGSVDTEDGGALDTADVERYPADGATPPGIGASAVTVDPKLATFAVGGGAQCAAPCADRSNARVGPQVWLSSALARAGQISGVRAFFYTGPGITTGETAGPPTLSIPYAAELSRYAGILGSSTLPAYAAISPSDLEGRPFREGTESTFEQIFEGFPQPFGNGPQAAGLSEAGRSGEHCAGSAGCQAAYYALESSGTAGSVRTIFLDDSGDVGATQLAWLAQQLSAAKGKGSPAIVLGNADLSAQIAAGDTAAAEVAQTLVSDGASAYFYDSREINVTRPLQVGAGSIPTFGSGTLGYIQHSAEESGQFLGASGFLLAQVDVAGRNPQTNVAPVSARLIPNIGELALEAKDGNLLRRSQPALFDALARRPRAGNRAQNKSVQPDTDPYIPIPSNCVGSKCANGLFPEYTFTSSRPDIGDFVAPDLASADSHAVELGSNGKPIPDPNSGLFCAYNAGTTIVTISTGGLSSSMPVTVQAGSVREPCGTQPLKELPSRHQPVPVLPTGPAPGPAGATPASALPPLVPVPPPPAVTPAPTPRTPPPFLLPATPSAALLAVVPPPLPTPARPTPPSGTSAVTSPVEAPEREEEEESATESVANSAVAYRSHEHEPAPAYVLGMLILAAFAGASARRRPRRGRRELRVAPATVSTSRAQRRMSARDPWDPRS